MSCNLLQQTRRFGLACGGAVLVSLTSGCTLPKMWQPSGEDIAPQRVQRREEAVQQFEIQRDTAQYQAAIDRWMAGDPDTCEAKLKVLVARNPNHLESRRALADLALERGDVQRAETELRALLKVKPDDAQTQHSLGLLLESTNRTAEAREHLVRAAELDPENEIYQLCLQSQASSDVLAPVVAQQR